MKPVAFFDLEAFPNYWLAMFQPEDGTPPFVFESTPYSRFENRELEAVLEQYTLVGFNSNHFDLPLVALALKDQDPAVLKKAANAIIREDLKPWRFEKRFNVRLPEVEHIDLIEVAPGKASLKIYGGRLHCPTMQDLPYEHDRELSNEEMDVVRAYCANDLEVTQRLYEELREPLELRRKMGEEYDVDLMSKSDAQIAEAVFKHEIEAVTGAGIKKQRDWAGQTIRYEAPEFIQFQTLELQQTLDLVTSSKFEIGGGGKIDDRALKSHRVRVGDGVYRMGIGGLHSCEEKQAVIPAEGQVLFDWDVESYYPRTILEQRLAPEHLGKPFLTVYDQLVKRRLDAKHAGDKSTADTLKIVINGSFGKFGSMWSFLHSPNLLLQTTLTGQLALLMLIEMFEQAGCTVKSANTDGVVVLAEDAEAMHRAVGEWEILTGYKCEGTQYLALFSRDVNSYIALKPDGGYKLKGTFARGGLMKNPTNLICTTAVIELLQRGTPLEQTIRACTDVRQFITIRTVKGGAMKDGVPLGRAVRWYYATGVEGVIQYKQNGYTVARSEGARPLMILPDSVPADLDYDWYIQEAKDMLEGIGYA